MSRKAERMSPLGHPRPQAQVKGVVLPCDDQAYGVINGEINDGIVFVSLTFGKDMAWGASDRLAVVVIDRYVLKVA